MYIVSTLHRIIILNITFGESTCTCITNGVQNIKIVMHLLCFFLNDKCFDSIKLSLSVYIIKKIARGLCMQGGV